MKDAPKFIDLFRFVLANKGHKTFIGMPEEQIALLLEACIKNGTLFYKCDKENNIIGTIIAELRPNNILFVTENLAMNIQNLKDFARKAKETWPNHKLQWLKRGIFKSPNTDKLWRKLHV